MADTKRFWEFSNLDYIIDEVTYRYNEFHPFDFYVSATVTVPSDMTLTVGLPFGTTFPFVEKNNPEMAKYVQKTIAKFKEESEPELKAFQMLEEEGFDMDKFMRYILFEIEIEVPTPDNPPETRIEDIVFSKIKYKILDVFYSYHEDETPRRFYIGINLEMPKMLAPDGINFELPLENVFSTVSMGGEHLVKYVKRVIANFEGEKDAELLAFQALEEEGFDLILFMDHMVRNMTIKRSKT